MTVANQFFAYPFGTAGDKTAVPNPTQVGGSVSYQSGFTVNYQEQLGVNPSALPINRAQFNQLMNDITTALSQYQSEGTPQWIPAAQTFDGNPYSYDIYARVRYNVGNPGVEGAGNLIYENQVQGNTATPGADSTWVVISASAAGVPTGTILDFGGNVAPSGYLLTNGAAVSRTTYASLLSKLAFAQSAVLNSSVDVSGLTSTTPMYVGMPVEGTDIQPGTTVAVIVDSTHITLSLAATGSTTTNLTFFPWGNGNGSTTFTVPNLNGYVTAGSNGSTTGGFVPFTATQAGQKGGEMSHTQRETELAAHNHPGSVFSVNAPTGAPAGASGAQVNPSGGSTQTVTMAIDGASVPFNIMQPTAIVTKIIKI